MTDSKHTRTVAFNITGSHEETDRKIQQILTLIRPDDYREAEVPLKSRSSWPLLENKSDPLPKPARPTRVTMYGVTAPVITPRTPQPPLAPPLACARSST